MIAPNENERATEVTPPVASVERASALPNAYTEYRRTPLTAEPLDESVIGQIHAADDFATDGAHRCEEGSCPQEVWYLAPEDTHALSDGGEPSWTITTMCLACRCIAVFYGATVQRTHWQDGAGNYGMGGDAA